MSSCRHASPADDISVSVSLLIDRLKGAGTVYNTSGAKAAGCSIQEISQQLCSLLSNIDFLRMEAHELLEAESISASNLRHKLSTLQKGFKIELADVTEETRVLIAQEKRKKQCLIEDIKVTRAQVCHKQSQLDLANHDLVIQLENCEVKYKELIGHVNDVITDRARVKIILNETQEELNSIKNMVQQCQRDISRTLEMSEIAKETFLTEINDSSTSLEKVKRLLDTENVKKRELIRRNDIVQKNLIEAKSAMEHAQMLLSQVEDRLLHEMELRDKLNIAIVEARKHAECLTKECVDIKEMAVLERECILSETEDLEKQYGLVAGVVDEIQAEVNALCIKQTAVQAALVKEMKLKDKYQSSVSSLKQRSALAKETLKYQSEKGADLQLQNRQMESELKASKQNFSVISLQLNSVLESLEAEFEEKECSRLCLERETKRLDEKIVVLEDELESMTQELEVVKEKSTAFCDSSKEKILDLQSASKNYEQQIHTLSKEQSKGVVELQSYIDTTQQKIHNLQESVKDLQGNISEKLALIQILEPDCSLLQHDHDKLNANYEEEKKCIIGMRSHRTTLKESAGRLEKQLKDTSNKQVRLRMEIIHDRTQTKDHFATQTQQTAGIETEVADTRHQLEAIVRENIKLQGVIDDMCWECQWMKEQLKRPPVHSVTQIMRENLDLDWKKDEEVEKVHRVHSKALLSKTMELSIQIKGKLQELDPENMSEQ